MSVAAVPAGSWGATVRWGATWRVAGWVLGASVCFHLAQTVMELSGLVLLFLWGVLGLSGLATWRRTFYATVVLGYAACAPHLAFFWTIFGPGALALWAILAAWLGCFAVLARLAQRRLPPLGAAMLRGELEPGRAGRLPLDHWLAPLAAGGTAMMLVGSFLFAGREVKRRG